MHNDFWIDQAPWIVVGAMIMFAILLIGAVAIAYLARPRRQPNPTPAAHTPDPHVVWQQPTWQQDPWLHTTTGSAKLVDATKLATVYEFDRSHRRPGGAA